jgi:hypothetical protein
LNTVKKSAAVVFGFAVYSIARMKYQNPLCSLFAIYAHLPKLNVAGSIPVSRSLPQLAGTQTELVARTFIARHVIVLSPASTIWCEYSRKISFARPENGGGAWKLGRRSLG